MRKIEIKASKDGSHTLYLPDLNETYHSIHGAVNESRHVFLKMGLDAVECPSVNILEIGFGTGLNAFLTLLDTQEKGIHVKYHTLEPYPIEKEIYTQLNYAEHIDPNKKEEFLNLHTLGWNVQHMLNDQFYFTKSTQKLEDITFKHQFDLIYFDAFAPNKQSELWETDVLLLCFEALKPEGILVTYCSQGQFKRNLSAAGFVVEKLEGPPGKREMTRGLKPRLPA